MKKKKKYVEYNFNAKWFILACLSALAGLPLFSIIFLYFGYKGKAVGYYD